MAQNMFTEGAKLAFDYAKQIGAKYGHSAITTNHIFLGAFRALKEDEESKEKYEALKNLMEKYNIDRSEFNTTFQMMFGEAVEAETEENYSPKYSLDYKAVYNNLVKYATENNTSVTIGDIIRELFSDVAYELYLVLESVVKDQGKLKEFYDKVEELFVPSIKFEGIADLDDILVNLNTWVKENNPKYISSEEDEKKFKALYTILGNKTVKSAIITGIQGTGKSAMVYELARRINDGEVPDFLKGKIIYDMDVTSLTSGTMFRGQLEEKVKNIMNICAENKDKVILFVDEVHGIVKAGESEGAPGVGNMIKPFLSKGEIQIIGATTPQEYRKYIERADKAFASRFCEIKISEPNDDQMRHLLKGLAPTEEEFFSTKITDSLIDSTIKMAKKYSFSQGGNPRKGILIFETACSYARLCKPGEEVDFKDIEESVALLYDLKIKKDRVAECEKVVKERIFGQEEATKRIIRNLKFADRGLNDPNKPLASFIFAGTTGCGKTEMAQQIAEGFFGDKEAFTYIDMTGYSLESDVTKLLGSGPSFVGYGDETELIKGCRQHPYQVLLFDEIEKAHPKIFDSLMRVLDKGILVTGDGEDIKFNQMVIVFTTNLGCSYDSGKAVGSGFIKSKIGNGKETIIKALQDFFRPEMLQRFDDVIVFNSLTNEIIEKLIKKMYDELAETYLGEMPSFDKIDIEKVKKESNIESNGAREIKRVLRNMIIDMEEGEE